MRGGMHLAVALLCLAAVILLLRESPAAPAGKLADLPNETAIVAVAGRTVAFSGYSLICADRCVRAYGLDAKNGSWTNAVGVWSGQGSLFVVRESWKPR